MTSISENTIADKINKKASQLIDKELQQEIISYVKTNNMSDYSITITFTYKNDSLKTDEVVPTKKDTCQEDLIMMNHLIEAFNKKSNMSCLDFFGLVDNLEVLSSRNSDRWQPIINALWYDYKFLKEGRNIYPMELKKIYDEHRNPNKISDLRNIEIKRFAPTKEEENKKYKEDYKKFIDKVDAINAKGSNISHPDFIKLINELEDLSSRKSDKFRPTINAAKYKLKEFVEKGKNMSVPEYTKVFEDFLTNPTIDPFRSDINEPKTNPIIDSKDLTQSDIDNLWNKLETIPGKGSHLYRKDLKGKVIFKRSYNKTSAMGWTLESIGFKGFIPDKKEENSDDSDDEDYYPSTKL